MSLSLSVQIWLDNVDVDACESKVIRRAFAVSVINWQPAAYRNRLE